MGKVDDNIRALELRIKELEEENNALSGRVEEAMLLTLIAESFESITNEVELIESVLEKIAILKQIPYCACYAWKENTLKQIGQYCSVISHSSSKEVISFSDELLIEIQVDEELQVCLKNRPGLITFTGGRSLFKPRDILVVPFRSRRVQKGIFVFVSSESQVSSFAQEPLPFRQIIQMITGKWDRISLLNELQIFNQSLEERVEERTAQLSESEERYRQLFNMANDAIYLWEVNKKEGILNCVQANNAVRQLTGYSHADIKNLSPFDLLSSSYTLSEQKAFEKLFRSKRASFVAAVKTKHSTIKLEFNTCRFQMLDKEVVIAIARDISERLVFEEKLIEAKNKAVESERLKSAFLANMSHEIRTPMNAIVGFSELLNKDVIKERELRMYSNIIFKNSMHLLNLIDDIVDYSKIEANQIIIVNSAVNINELLSDLSLNVISVLRNASKDHIDIVTHMPLDDEQATIMVDGTRLRQVIANLINNAIKFTNEGCIEIGYVVKTKEWLEFYVSDTGLGIANQDQQKIFERFVQLKDEKAINPGGTGLGLAICSNLVEKMKGNIYLESELAKGTTFFFTIPYKLIKTVPSI